MPCGRPAKRRVGAAASSMTKTPLSSARLIRRPNAWLMRARAMESALADAGIPGEAVHYINAHGTSTPLGDKAETAAIKRVFGAHAGRLAVSSTKSSLGHTLGASGGIELVVCSLTIARGIITPTINYHTPDPACDLDYTPNTARDARVDVAMSNSFGFGGHNASLVLARLA